MVKQAELFAAIAEKIGVPTPMGHSVAVQQPFRQNGIPDHEAPDQEALDQEALGLPVSLAAVLAASPSSFAWLERASICARMNSEWSRRIS